jgi:hypothetical protein
LDLRGRSDRCAAGTPRVEARRRGLSIADVATQAIEQYLPLPPDGGWLGFFAVGEGTPPDVSQRVGDHVGEEIARHREIPRPCDGEPSPRSC